jgi:hypothetical protein
MLDKHPQIDALSRALDDLATPGHAEPRELVDAREAVHRAADAVAQESHAAGPEVERALSLARMALDRARRAVGMVDAHRPSWQEALRVPVRPPGATSAGARPRTEATPRAPDVQLDSEIPDGHPAKEAIETSVAGAFAGVKGQWRVAILVQPHASWWGVRVEGAHICWTGTLEGPEEQSPEFLSGRVREAVQLGLMQAALRPPRKRG